MKDKKEMPVKAENPQKKDAELTEIQQLIASAHRQENMAKRGLWHQRIRTVLVLIVAVVAIGMIQTVNTTMHDVQMLTGNASYAVTDLLNTVNALDLQDTLGAIDGLVSDSTALIRNGNNMIQSSSDDIEKSLKAIADLDITGLNDSIKALEAITTSIGKFFGYKSK